MGGDAKQLQLKYGGNDHCINVVGTGGGNGPAAFAGRGPAQRGAVAASRCRNRIGTRRGSRARSRCPPRSSMCSCSRNERIMFR